MAYAMDEKVEHGDSGKPKEAAAGVIPAVMKKRDGDLETLTDDMRVSEEAEQMLEDGKMMRENDDIATFMRKRPLTAEDKPQNGTIVAVVQKRAKLLEALIDDAQETKMLLEEKRKLERMAAPLHKRTPPKLGASAGEGSPTSTEEGESRRGSAPSGEAAACSSSGPGMDDVVTTQPQGVGNGWPLEDCPEEPAMDSGLESLQMGNPKEEVAKVGSGRESVKRPDIVAEADGVEERRRAGGGEWFVLTDSCLLALHRGDITEWHIDGKADAIVNAANELMLGGGGVDGAIHRAAGRKLRDACSEKPQVTPGVRCPVGHAVVTGGFNLPASKVIHTVGPIYDEERNPEDLLVKAYKSSLAAAVEAGVKYIAFPAISCGIYGYPNEEAAQVALQALQEAAAGLVEIHFVLFEKGTWKAWLAAAEKGLHRLAL